jgi:hypothetical protein
MEMDPFLSSFSHFLIVNKTSLPPPLKVREGGLLLTSNTKDWVSS